MDNVSKDEFLRLSRRVKEIPGQSELISAVKRAMYRVGDIIVTTVSTNPAADYGGTWVAWGSGRVPVGVNAADADLDAAEKTGGEKTHQLTAPELPKNAYGINLAREDNTGTRQVSWVTIGRSGANTWPNQKACVESDANDVPHNNMPPYIAVYMWKKTA